VKDPLTTNRLVMLTGAGGAGKTRRGLQVAGQLLDVFPHRRICWWCSTMPSTCSMRACSAEGRAMTLDHAVKHALSGQDTPQRH